MKLQDFFLFKFKKKNNVFYYSQSNITLSIFLLKKLNTIFLTKTAENKFEILFL